MFYWFERRPSFPEHPKAIKKQKLWLLSICKYNFIRIEVYHWCAGQFFFCNSFSGMSWITLKIWLFKVHIETYLDSVLTSIYLPLVIIKVCFDFWQNLCIRGMFNAFWTYAMIWGTYDHWFCKVPQLQHQPGMIIVNNNPTLRHILNLPVINFTL